MSALITYLDDFYSGFIYEGNWTTPDTSSRTYSNPAYFDGTFHSSQSASDRVSLNFTSNSIKIYGSGAAQAVLDGIAISSLASTTNGSQIIFSALNLTQGPHKLSLSGSSVLIDYATIVNPAISVGVNVTVEDNSSKLTYIGNWSSNNDTRFSGNTSTYTNLNQATVSLSFIGSTVYVYGDTVNDHGLFQVSLDGSNSVYNGKTEYLKIGTLKYFATGLSNSSHTLKITNLGSTFFGISSSFALAVTQADPLVDIDSIVYTTFSQLVTPSPSGSSNVSTTSSSILPKMTSSSSKLLLPGYLMLIAMIFN